jgi:hypothetical protein
VVLALKAERRKKPEEGKRVDDERGCDEGRRLFG